MNKAKKATADTADRIAKTIGFYGPYQTRIARKIRAAIRRAVRDGFDAGVEYANALRRDNASTDHLSAILARIERKHGVKL